MIDSTALERPPPPHRTRTADAARELDALVASARERVVVLRGLFGAGLGLSGAALLTLGTAALLGNHPTAALVRDLGLLGSATSLALVGPAVAAIARRRLTAIKLGSLVTGSDSRLRSLLLSALELRTLPDAHGLSTHLIQAQAAFAATRLREIDPLQEISDQPARSSLVLGVSLVVAVTAALARGPDTLQRGLLALRNPPPVTKGSAAREPITGDIELTLFYPPHTRLAPRTIAGTNGEIEAPAGTKVKVRTRADRPVREAAMLVNGEAVALTVEHERQLAGDFVVSKAGSYSFRFGPKGHPIAEGPPIPIAVMADAPPQVTLTAPPESLEVDPHQVLTLQYQVSDDYGISDVQLVYRLPGSETDVSVPLKKLEDPPLRVEGTARFDLADLHLLSGDELAYFIEAHDNDGVQGPKAGRSRPHHLKVYSEVEHHREALARARALWERLLLLLADRLDESSAATPPAAGQAADLRALMLAQELAREGGSLKGDKKLAAALVNAGHEERRRASLTADARELLESFAGSRAPGTAALASFRRTLGEEAEGLERDTLYLEGLLDQATKDDLLTLSKELRERRRELSDLIEKYRKHPTAEAKAEIQALLSRLKSRMGELFSRMQELAKTISDEHLNHEALAAMRKNQDMGAEISKADDALRSGDMDGALKSLDQLAAQLDSVEKRLDQAKSRQSEAYPGLSKKVAEFKDQLDEVQKQEQAIAERTEALERQARKAAADRAPASPQLLEKLKADTARARAELDAIPEGAVSRGAAAEELSRAREGTEQLARALQASDLEEARRSATDALEAAEQAKNPVDRNPFSLLDPFRDAPPKRTTDAANAHLDQAAPLLRSVRAQLQKLFPDEKTLLTPAQQQQLGQLQHDQQKAQDGAKKLSQQLEQINKQAPIFDPSAAEALDQAGNQMGDAEAQLSRREPGKAGEEARGATEQLRRVSQAMESGAGKQGQGDMPGPYAMGMPSSGSEGGEGDDASEHEKVVVPGADQYQVPAEFRRDILDAMKQKAPDSFEDQVKHYYREIVK